jgi:hypothetical protein
MELQIVRIRNGVASQQVVREVKPTQKNVENFPFDASSRAKSDKFVPFAAHIERNFPFLKSGNSSRTACQHLTLRIPMPKDKCQMLRRDPVFFLQDFFEGFVPNPQLF